MKEGHAKADKTADNEEKNDDSDIDNNENKMDLNGIKMHDLKAQSSDIEEDAAVADRYSFGKRYYYWPKYKRDKYEWYIEQKYDNLKEEILKNKICRLDIDIFENAFEKASQFIASDTCKRMKACYTNHLLYYDIRGGQPLNIDNLLAIILYTDFSRLCYEFGKTFRKINKSESNDALKLRNAEFWNWSRLLRETVEYYGDPLWKSDIKIFYSGCSYLVLDTFVANFCGPTSTSPQLSVATIFAKEEGMILELEMADSRKAGHLRFFDCSFLSCYSSEDERLFCGMLSINIDQT